MALTQPRGVIEIGELSDSARGCVWMYEEAGRVSRHAAGRFIERCGEAEESLARIAASAVLTLRFVRQLRRSQDLAARIIPVPDVEAKMIAIVDASEGAIVTYVNRQMLRIAREAWVAKFDAFDQSVKDGEAVIETRAKGYAALLNEGARIWAETRERQGVAA